MFDLTLFRNRTFVGASIAAFALSASMFAMFLYITLYVQTILGYDAAGDRPALPADHAAVVRRRGGVGQAHGEAPGARTARRRPDPRRERAAAHARASTPSRAGPQLLPGFLVAGIGIGTINPSIANAAIGVVTPARSGMASGISSTFRQVGIATGIAGLGAIFQSQITQRLTTALAGTPGASRTDQIAHAVSAGAAPKAIAASPPAARPRLEHAIHVAFTAALNDILLVGGAIAFAGGLLALALVRGSDFLGHGPPPAAAAATPPAAA